MNLSKEFFLGLAVFAAVGCGLIGGLLFTFSNFVMKALSQQPPDSSIRTMQAINIYILNPLFLFVFLGAAVASAILAVATVSRLSYPGAPLLLVGCILYIVGVVGVTMVFNVPLNNKLAEQNPTTVEAAQFWLTYVSEWMKWNHVRTIASLMAAVLLILAIRQGHFPTE
jgi:uncharacterized membrane protein